MMAKEEEKYCGIIEYPKKEPVLYSEQKKASFYFDVLDHPEQICAAAWSDTPRSISNLSKMAKGAA